MFNNDSNTSLVMVGTPYHIAHAQGHVYKPTPTGTGVFNHFNPFDPRLAPRPQHDYYLHQQRTIEIIQLEEVPPPSKREHISVPGSSSFASSSSSYATSSSSYSEEEGGESYCSSEEQSEEEYTEAEEVERGGMTADSFQARMRRIEQWRDAYAKAVGAELAPSPSRSKRKSVDGCDGDEDAMVNNNESDTVLSHSSKRSRHGSISGSASTSTSVRSLHSCSACDAWFPDRGSLRNHGSSPNEACRAAVEYDFEEK